MKAHRDLQSLGPRDAPHYYEIVRDELRHNIDAGFLPPGTILYEAAVADRFGVSRPPVRRALELLAEEGRIRRATGRGFIVGTGPSLLPRRRNLHVLRLDLSARLGGETARAAWQHIYDETEAAILACTPFGTYQISEAALGAHFSVSRTVVRDVLVRMHSRGLIEKDRRSHWIAGPLSARMLDDCHELRILLEPGALARALSQLDRAELVAMRERLRTVLEKPDTADPPLIGTLETDLHQDCIRPVRNKHLVEAVRQAQVSLVIDRLFATYIGVHDLSDMLREHALVFDHLLLGDARGAAAALEHHLNAAHLRTRARLKVLSMFSEPEIAPYLSRIH